MHPLLTLPREALVFHVLPPAYDGDAEVRLGYEIRRADESGGEGEVLAGFTEVVTLPGVRVDLKPDAQDQFARVLRLLALTAGVSYFKTCIPSRVVVSGGLSDSERHFTETVMVNGLAEFAFRNQRPEALRFEVAGPHLDDTPPTPAPAVTPTRPLVAVGGGKDSIVTIETLRGARVVPTLFSVNDYLPIRATANHADLPLLTATRRLDPLLFEFNAAGALNGHVPVTAINSLIGVLSALRTGHDAVVFSNEASSSAGNTTWEGVDVNHQWSKGLGFESLLRDLVGGPVSYFSLLRPLTELAITRRFAQLSGYHPVFTSCNRAFHLDESKRRLWCGDCPKCRFVTLCLAPFVARDALLAIFGGRDLFADPSQREGFLELLNAGDRMKPFECVGEPSECRAALTLLSQHDEWSGHAFFDDPEVSACLIDDTEVARAFTFEDAHHLPADLEKAVRALS